MSTYSEALAFSASYCSRTERCRSEVLSAIEKYELTSSDREALLSHLEREGYLDEARYARAFVSDRFRFQHWGRIKIRHALAEKRVPAMIADEALSVIPEEEYMETLKKLVTDKLSHTEAADDYALAAKVLRFAFGKGYEPDCVRKCLPDFLNGF